MKKPKLKYYNGLKNRFKNDWLIIVDTISILAVCLGLICFLMLFIYPWFTGKYLTPDTFFGGVAIKVIGGMAIFINCRNIYFHRR
ncbi:hypothetical protein [Neisseria dentiae]|uniref:hypothetical protein n=1 Tax=Neisseria dentiae TaxID=194197 RepID=UPI00359FD803